MWVGLLLHQMKLREDFLSLGIRNICPMAKESHSHNLSLHKTAMPRKSCFWINFPGLKRFVFLAFLVLLAFICTCICWMYGERKTTCASKRSEELWIRMDGGLKRFQRKHRHTWRFSRLEIEILATRLKKSIEKQWLVIQCGNLLSLTRRNTEEGSVWTAVPCSSGREELFKEEQAEKMKEKQKEKKRGVKAPAPCDSTWLHVLLWSLRLCLTGCLGGDLWHRWIGRSARDWILGHVFWCAYV